MLNTKTLREQFKAIRAKQKQSATIGQWIITAVIVITMAIVLAFLVRIFCIELVYVSTLLKG